MIDQSRPQPEPKPVKPQPHPETPLPTFRDVEFALQAGMVRAMASELKPKAFLFSPLAWQIALKQYPSGWPPPTQWCGVPVTVARHYPGIIVTVLAA